MISITLGRPGVARHGVIRSGSVRAVDLTAAAACGGGRDAKYFAIPGRDDGGRLVGVLARGLGADNAGARTW